jgi:hypothetical protein
LDRAVCHSLEWRKKKNTFLWCGNILEWASSNLFRLLCTRHCRCIRWNFAFYFGCVCVCIRKTKWLFQKRKSESTWKSLHTQKERRK